MLVRVFMAKYNTYICLLVHAKSMPSMKTLFFAIKTQCVIYRKRGTINTGVL